MKIANCIHTYTVFLSSSLCLLIPSEGKLQFDIYGNPKKFDPSHSVEVNPETCEYKAEVKMRWSNIGLPFPDGAEDCNPATLSTSTKCDGQSCLFEIHNAYKFSKKFQEVTGFKHMGLDWSPCGHPPLENFARPHGNLHLYRVTPEERQDVFCDMANPFICAPLDEQTTVNGKKFYIVSKNAFDDKLANVPDGFGLGDLSHAVPSEGIHTLNFEGAPQVAEWSEPVLVMGLYDGGVQFWEPMFPYEFVSGDVAKTYEEYPTYAAQTVMSLPSYWKMEYNPDDEVTTLTFVGMAENCSGDDYRKIPKGAKAPKTPKVSKGKGPRKIRG